MMKNTTKTQQCGHCLKEINSTERYPNRLCDDCYKLLTDSTGRSVAYVNDEFSDNVLGVYTDVIPPVPYESLICYIGNIAFRAEEGRFGGIVVQRLRTD